MYGCCLWLFISAQWGHSSIDNAIRYFLCLVLCLRSTKLKPCLVWMFLWSSNGFSSFKLSSSKIILWSTTFAIKMFKMIFQSDYQQGLAIMWKWDFNTSNALQNEILPTNFMYNRKMNSFSPFSSWIVYTKIDQHR